jgi:hypothetical protein
MTRALFGEALLFFVPFAAFAAYLILRRRTVFAWRSWSDQSLWLVISGLALAILALLITGITAERQTGAFQPTRVENGRIIPGEFR